MLKTWRTQIDAFLTARRLRFREDASNASPEHTRNRIRRELFPFLETLLGRNVRGSLVRAAEIARAEEDFFSTLVEADPGPTLSTPQLRALPLALQRRQIFAWLRSQGAPDIGFEEVENVRALLKVEGLIPSKMNLPGGWHVRRRNKVLFLEGRK